jgi:drug/metabolite transporter (DMT)-like permease
MTTDRQTVIATLVGGIAVLLWSTLALLTVEASGLPRFQLLAMTFSVATVAFLVVILRRGLGGLDLLRQPWPVWAQGVAALFLYHTVYFYALDAAPAVEAQLIAFLWPLLLVLFSAFLPGGGLRWFHLVGAALGFLGAALLISGGELALKSQFWVGYLLAFGCALIWSTYSVANKRHGKVPSEVVGGYCGVVAILGYFFHLVFEKTVVPTGGQWLAIVGLGIGPVGLAFFVWDYGTKRGSLPVLGALSYAAPLISTLLLLLFGHGKETKLWVVAAACLLIVGGALLASKELILGRAGKAAAAPEPPPALGS